MGTVDKAGDVYVGTDGWFVGKFRMGGVGVDCDSTLAGSGDGSLAVNEACEGADRVIGIELVIGLSV